MEPTQLVDLIQSLGANKAAVIEVSAIPFNTEHRKACEVNACGNYGRSWMCPPDVGEIDDLIQQAKQYKWAVVYQTVGTLEDSYDFEGMMEAGQKHNQLAQTISSAVSPEMNQPYLHLGAGGCRVCEVCAKKVGEPCRFPEQAMSSLEAYGVSVSELAALCGMNYINGVNTVTYFGTLLYDAAE